MLFNAEQILMVIDIEKRLLFLKKTSPSRNSNKTSRRNLVETLGN